MVMVFTFLFKKDSEFSLIVHLVIQAVYCLYLGLAKSRMRYRRHKHRPFFFFFLTFIYFELLFTSFFFEDFCFIYPLFYGMEYSTESYSEQANQVSAIISGV